MDVKSAYNQWALQYDTNQNKTRDLEAIVLRKKLNNLSFDNVLEIGCGTGKNTQWLVTKAKQIVAVDLSKEMLAKAKEKIDSSKVNFIQADITEKWDFSGKPFDLVTFSLVLEHIENLEAVFSNVFDFLKPGGLCYVGELHPYKQYSGTKARFETDEGLKIVNCYNHHVSDLVTSAKRSGLHLVDIDEHFDDEPDRNIIPRILSLIFRK